MGKLDCQIIKDLLPLYIDKVCSEESANAVEEHLRSCPICEADLTKLQATPDIAPVVDEDFESAVKKANKRIIKSKKKAVVKTLSITLSILLVIGIIAYLIVPIKVAYHNYCNDGYLYSLCGLIDIDVHNKQKADFKGQYADIYIDKSLGKYTTEKIESGNKIIFEDGKELYITYLPTDKSTIKSFYEENGVFGINAGGYRFPYFNPIIKKGVEYMGIDPDKMYTDNKLYTKLLHSIDEKWADHRVPLNPKDFAMWYTYFALFTNIMPYGAPGISYYIHAQNDSMQGWGWSSFHEDVGNRYILNLQQKDDIYGNYNFIFMGFQREEMINVVESIVLK